MALSYLSFELLIGQHMGRSWESALHFELTTTASFPVQNVQQALLEGIKWCFVSLSLCPCRFIRFRLRWLLLRFLNSRLPLLHQFSSSALLQFLLFSFSFGILPITGIHRMVCFYVCLCCYPDFPWWLLLRNGSCLCVGCDTWLFIGYCLPQLIHVLCGLSYRLLLITYGDEDCSSFGFLLVMVPLVLL